MSNSTPNLKIIGFIIILIIIALIFTAWIYPIYTQNKNTKKTSNCNIAYRLYTDSLTEKTHVIYNGKDLGEGYGITLAANNIAFLRDINGINHVIYNGEDLGEVGPLYFSPMIQLSKNNIAFLQAVDLNKNICNIIYNNQVLGEARCDYSIQLSDNNLVYTNSKFHTIFNGKDFGYTVDYKLSDNDLGIIRKENDKYYFIFNGENKGELGIEQARNLEFDISDGNFAFGRIIDGKQHIIYNGKDMGEGKYVSLSGDNIAFIKEIDGVFHVIFNGNDMGEGRLPLQLSGNNIAFKRDINGKPHVIFNGKDMGEIAETCSGCSPLYILLSNDNIAFERVKDGHIIFNGKDMGVGDAFTMNISDNNIIFEREINNKTHIIYNGRDLGLGRVPQILCEKGPSF